MDSMNIRSSHRPDISWAVVSSGLWLRLAFVGAAFAAYGVASAVAGELGIAPALGFVAGGGSVATFALRRSFRVLEDRHDQPAGQRPAVKPVTLQTSKA